MKFSKIAIPERITQEKGIHELNLARLSNVIAFIGKNGSGKTRILDLIEEHLFKTIRVSWIKSGDIEFPDNEIIKNFIRSARSYWQVALFYEKQEELLDKIDVDPSQENYDELARFKNDNQVDAVKLNHFVNIVGQLRKISRTWEKTYLRRIRYSEIQQLQAAFNSKPEESLSFENLIENVSENIVYNEFSSIHKTSLRYLTKLPHQLMHDYMEAFGDRDLYEAKIAHSRFISLKKLFKDFLNKDLTWERKSTNSVINEDGVQAHYAGIWKLDKREFNYSEFSDGEKTLFAYALLFFLIDANPKLNIKNSIVLIDEPELHLHPEAEIDLINGIRNAIGVHGQLIFTTHSINILSHLNYDEIFMVKNGKIAHPSRSTVGNTLSELMGLENRISKLSDFLSSIATWTFVNFMAECFSNPEVIKSSQSDDPQLLAFKKAVKENLTNKNSLLLDFGAGKGRILEQLKSDYDFMNNVSYAALEPEKEFREILKSLGASDVFESYLELPKNNFDFVLLCNVLHEIPIIEWVDTLNKVVDTLNDKGYLIIIEAKVLTKGEKIGEEGFILLGVEEIKKLFDLKNEPLSIEIPGKENLITCVAIGKSQLAKIDTAKLLATLETLRENTLDKIIKLRKVSTEDKSNVIGFGRKNAFLSQLHINSQIAQMKLKGVV